MEPKVPNKYKVAFESFKNKFTVTFSRVLFSRKCISFNQRLKT